MSKENSWIATLAAWERLLAAVDANQEDLPQVEASCRQLEASVTALKVLQARREALRGEMLRETQDLRSFLAQGRELATRVRDGVRSQYGFRNDKLIEFGMKPIRKRKGPRGSPGVKEKEAPRNPTAP